LSPAPDFQWATVDGAEFRICGFKAISYDRMTAMSCETCTRDAVRIRGPRFEMIA